MTELAKCRCGAEADVGDVMGEEDECGFIWVARCYLTDETRECANPWAARAWLEERVRAAGFEIREEVSDG